MTVVNPKMEMCSDVHPQTGCLFTGLQPPKVVVLDTNISAAKRKTNAENAINFVVKKKTEHPSAVIFNAKKYDLIREIIIVQFI
jgi:hypothetical protein